MSGLWDSTLPVVTLVLGYLGTIVTENRQHARAVRLSNQERVDALSTTRNADRREFELETLHAVQEALANLGRALGRGHMFDLTAARDAGIDKYPSTQLPEDINDEQFQTLRRVNALVGLILDDDTRSAVEAARTAAGQLAVPLRGGTVADGEGRFAAAVSSIDGAQQAVAARIRTVYAQ